MLLNSFVFDVVFLCHFTSTKQDTGIISYPYFKKTVLFSCPVSFLFGLLPLVLFQFSAQQYLSSSLKRFYSMSDDRSATFSLPPSEIFCISQPQNAQNLCHLSKLLYILSVFSSFVCCLLDFLPTYWHFSDINLWVSSYFKSTLWIHQ